MQKTRQSKKLGRAGVGSGRKNTSKEDEDGAITKSVARRLLASQERLDTIMGASPVALWMTDADGQMMFVNQTWIDWTGQPFESHLGKGWQKHIIPEDRNSKSKRLDSVLASAPNIRQSSASKTLAAKSAGLARTANPIMTITANLAAMVVAA
jgi:PAS domain-containing protein